MRQEAIKILGENTGSNLCDLGHSKFLLDMFPKARETKAKMNFWDIIKIKSFCTAKEIVNKMKTKRQPMEWEKIFVNDVTDKVLVSKIYKELLKFNSQKTNNQIKNGQHQTLHRNLGMYCMVINITDKGLVSKIYKEFLKLHPKNK